MKTSRTIPRGGFDVVGGYEVKIEAQEINTLLGKLLTIIDATYNDREQKENVKSLVKDSVWTWGKEYHFGLTPEGMEVFMDANSQGCAAPIPKELAKNL